MGESNNRLEESFFDSLRNQFNQGESVDVDAAMAFARRIFDLAPIDELIDESCADLCGMTLSLRDYLNTFPPGAPKVRSFNPNLDEDGWEHRWTHIFVLQRDMAFLVDSVRMVFSRFGLGVHGISSTVFDVVRDPAGNLVNLSGEPVEGSRREALMYFQVDHYQSRDRHEKVVAEIRDVLDGVEIVNEDFHPMTEQLDQVIDSLGRYSPNNGKEDLSESLAFLRWLRDNHFTFLAYGYSSIEKGDDPLVAPVADRNLGLYKHWLETGDASRLSDLTQGMRQFYHDEKSVILVKKSTVMSRIHRDAYCDEVVIKDMDGTGRAVAEHRFVGLYTSLVYAQSSFEVPIVRLKLRRIIERSGLNPNGHYGKSLRQVMETHPREELLNASEEQLYRTLIGIWQINERRQVRLFTRLDPFDEFINCLVFFPRDTYRTQVREQTQQLLMDTLGAGECQFYTYFTQSLLVRTHFVMRVGEHGVPDVDERDLERRIAEIAHDWRDDLHLAIVAHWGDDRGIELSEAYRDAFPVSYHSHFEPRTAVQDISLFHNLAEDDDIALSFFKPQGAAQGIMRLKVFHRTTELPLSRMVPMLENLGFTVIGEHPYAIRPDGAPQVWMHDFTLKFSLDITIDVPGVRENFGDAFKAVWRGTSDDDKFNWLVIGARLDWRSVALMRVYARYMKQLGISISQDFIAATLAQNLDITRNLIALFKSIFEPRLVASAADGPGMAERSRRLRAKVLESLDSVANLNQDQVLRTILEMICATQRTNFFRRGEDGEHHGYIAIKLAPSELVVVPEPRPAFEIFVYSPRFEGVHLRAGKVARGGIRWSDRLEDYRTEILGLVKAQLVKNAVIVPTGAKGGFVVKTPTVGMSRSEQFEEGRACYLLFMAALLGVTDNIEEGSVVPPPDVVRLDGDDPYLVVAADKGTATFSDYANEVSRKFDHWLGDAFASGGSHGYDHKKMGITARGAWVAVQRHFRELGINTQEEDFTVVGIGDMAGDVFGNGMLLSSHMRLVAAFNHRHIFIDPDPDAATSFAERRRLFEAPNSSWADYDDKLISRGGGVFSRDAKSIELSPEIKQRFDIAEDELTPAHFIKRLLLAPVDLIWNGGIGTYVKSSRESNQEAGDRANDELRVNGRELRCKVVGEGGNLGMTQMGRIEYCLNGGACNTDFIDNSGGVDCSDQEVNIKIALNQLVANEDMTFKQRNALLEEMTEEVADKVLLHNYRQTQNLTLATRRSKANPSEFWHCLTDWESRGLINRALEDLPDDEVLQERQKKGSFLSRPELAVLLSYSKILFKGELQRTAIHEDGRIVGEIARAFPKTLVDRYPEAITNHTLRREVLCNQLANEMIDFMGLTFVHRQMSATGADAEDIARAYLITREVFNVEAAWREVEQLDYKIPAETQVLLQLSLMRLGRRATRWLLRNRRNCTNTENEIELLKPILQGLLERGIATQKSGDEEPQTDIPGLFQLGLSPYASMLVDSAADLYFALGMADAKIRTGADMEAVTDIYGYLGDLLYLEQFIQKLVNFTPADRWEDLARESLMDELESHFRRLAIYLLAGIGSDGDVAEGVDAWYETRKPLVDRWREIAREAETTSDSGIAMFSVALRELADLAAGSAGAEEGFPQYCAQ